jgi:Condensation domain/TubC N-terminal docking domain
MTDNGKDLLRSLRERGVQLWTEKGQLRYRAPKGTLLPGELNDILGRRQEIIKLLALTEFSAEVPLQPRPSGVPVPLTPFQRVFWKGYRDKSIPEIREGIVAMRIVGPLDLAHVRRSVQALVRRHESLRTRITTSDGTISQAIGSTEEPLLDVGDLSHLSDSGCETEMGHQVAKLTTETVDSTIDPLFLAKLFTLRKCEHVLIFALSHLITDGASNEILFREFWILYDQAVNQSGAPLPPLAIQFPDYAVWLERSYDTWCARHGSFWRDHLRGAPATTLPIDTMASRVESRISQGLTIPFGADLTKAIRAVSEQEHTLTALSVLTLYSIVQSHWCAKDELLIVLVAASRHLPELENVVGFVASELYLRISISARDSFVDILQQITKEFIVAHDHFDFGRLAEFAPECAVPALHFNWITNLHERAEECHGQLRVRPIRIQIPRALGFFPFFWDGAHGITGRIVYREDYYSTTTIQRFAKNLLRLAHKSVTCPRDPIALSILQ